MFVIEIFAGGLEQYQQTHNEKSAEYYSEQPFFPLWKETDDVFVFIHYFPPIS